MLERTHRKPSLGSTTPDKMSAESTCLLFILHNLPLCSPLFTASLQRCSSSVSMTALITPLGYCCKICMASLLLQLKGGQREIFFSQKSQTDKPKFKLVHCNKMGLNVLQLVQMPSGSIQRGINYQLLHRVIQTVILYALRKFPIIYRGGPRDSYWVAYKHQTIRMSCQLGQLK